MTFWVLIAAGGCLVGWLGAQILHVVGRRRRPARLEECETCGKALKPAEVWELREYPDDDAKLGNPAGHGGTYMSAIYCRQHFPAGRQRHVP